MTRWWFPIVITTRRRYDAELKRARSRGWSDGYDSGHADAIRQEALECRYNPMWKRRDR